MGRADRCLHGIAVDPVLPLAFLNEVYGVLEYYIGGPVTEASVKVSIAAPPTGLHTRRTPDPAAGTVLTALSAAPCQPVGPL